MNNASGSDTVNESGHAGMEPLQEQEALHGIDLTDVQNVQAAVAGTELAPIFKNLHNLGQINDIPTYFTPEDPVQSDWDVNAIESEIACEIYIGFQIVHWNKGPGRKIRIQEYVRIKDDEFPDQIVLTPLKSEDVTNDVYKELYVPVIQYLLQQGLGERVQNLLAKYTGAKTPAAMETDNNVGDSSEMNNLMDVTNDAKDDKI